ncbi:DivIVA domain-containing protein [Paenibacillus dendritiformis]|nr:DivIVA domain-containing protein [Paenibacillus dendritiformis]NRG00093.1 DivIVA domain-containing protein [Paenibacillus dendritiformis]
MRFTPLDIHNQEFDRTFRGYNEDQVNEYLDLIIKDYQTYNQIIQELQAQIAELLHEDAPSRLSLT